ncbi:hypothetical protein XU18_2068 [Perkinsela sp. CCAP 1560/4]|nr:hypothetical protein XU18_2068 [Perkinsela sp. CCAP 1560/4]|eukprot:KNH07536.1 hypothetical protein XU18_2068 [Perkinsela sp. CCAP 1560/4]
MVQPEVSLETALEAHIIDYLRRLGYLHLVRRFSDVFSKRGVELSQNLCYVLPNLTSEKLAWFSFSGEFQYTDVSYCFDKAGRRVKSSRDPHLRVGDYRSLPTRKRGRKALEE